NLSMNSFPAFTTPISLSYQVSPNTLSSPPTVSFSPSSFTLSAGQSASSTMTIQTTSSTTAASYSVTVTGSDDTGALSHSKTISFNVVNPDFTISANPTSTTASQGVPGTSTITIKSQNT